MGSATSKFKKYVHQGDEYAAMQAYQSSPELRRTFDPNISFGDSHNHNTALHYAARHAMKHLLRMFVKELGGNPNKRNAFNETALHLVCQPGLVPGRSYTSEERRAFCLTTLLCWGSDSERVDPNAQDKFGNTALHLAAANGLHRCVQLLLAHGASVFAENKDRLTPCDLAMKHEHHAIARLLEARMVFAECNDVINEDELTHKEPEETEALYSGLRSQELQEAKDQLLVETSDMLGLALNTTEALLSHYDWSRETLLDKWMKDAQSCCASAGVQLPEHTADKTLPSQTPPSSSMLCEICLTDTLKSEQEAMNCGHSFCRQCWSTYLSTRISQGQVEGILCPGQDCNLLLPATAIESLVSPKTSRKYLQYGLEAFVERSKSIKWCPVAGCGRAVRLDHNQINSAKNFSHAVDCGDGHFFCWDCLGEAHAPSGCAEWRMWQTKISQVKPEELEKSSIQSEHAANVLWLVTNCKPCPSCQSPIQKNEGCNHIKCSKCKFDFCWVCLEPWKKHSSATGGYFRCNRFEAVNKADEKQGILISEAVVRNRETTELTRFLHYYTRFRNHENSRKLEEPLLRSAKQKMQALAVGLQKNNGGSSTKFVEDGVKELLKARRTLCGSYVFGYYLEDQGYTRSIFELMQNDLEEVTEKLSEMVARPYLRTPRSLIVQTTALTKRRRRALSRGLAGPELTSPGARPYATWDSRRKHHLYPLTPWSTLCLGRVCAMSGCRKIRQEGNSYCSLECSLLDKDHQISMGENVELAIALEMSRLQMIEDQVKQRQREQKDRLKQHKTTDHTSSQTDLQLDLAIRLSLEVDTSTSTNPAPSCSDSQTSTQDLTVHSFLRSLAGRAIDVKWFGPIQSDWNRHELRAEDGRFEISDMHDGQFVGLEEDDQPRQLRRSHSTGDIGVRPRLLAREEPRYHLDSDHSSQHDDRPEEIPRGKPRPSASPSSIPGFGGHSSVEDTTTSESIPVSTPSKAPEKTTKTLGVIGKKNALDIPDGTFSRDKSSFSLSSESSVFDDAPVVGQCSVPSVSATSSTNTGPTRNKVSLRIEVGSQKRLETDSSAESETGIPKSPSLYISGVSICRTPEPRSPGRNSRSSSLTVPEKDQTSLPPSPTLQTLQSSTDNLKSPTQEGLSSVLMVEESNLSCDDFHESLFLYESSSSSPKATGSKKRKRMSSYRNKATLPTNVQPSSLL